MCAKKKSESSIRAKAHGYLRDLGTCCSPRVDGVVLPDVRISPLAQLYRYRSFARYPLDAY
jgi:hypothetical protein